MSRDEGGGGYADLTPGDFHVTQPTEVDTTSLGGFGRTYEWDTQLFFGGNLTMPLGKLLGESGIGNSSAFHELGGINHLSTLSGEYAERNSTDLLYGNRALGNAAMYMAEQYASTDIFNAAITADSVSDVFNPTGDAGHTLLQDRLQQEQARAEAEARAEAAAAVDGSDRHFYNLLGISPPAPPASIAAPGTPTTVPDDGEVSPIAEFNAIEDESDYDADREVEMPDLVEPATPAAPGPDGVVSDVGDWAEDNLTIDPRQMRP